MKTRKGHLYAARLLVPTATEQGTNSQLRRIAKRYVAHLKELEIDFGYPVGDVLVRLAVVHAREPINLEKLESFDRLNFCHDVGGIFVNARPDGSLSNFFWPRCGGAE